MNSSLRNNIWKYYAINVFTKRLIVPILVVFFLAKELSATEIGLIFSLGTIAALLFEVPSGFMSDKLGHKKAIAISFFVQCISMLLYAFGDSFSIFLSATIIYWLGNSLWTGTGSALLFETLKDLNRSDDYEKILGRATTISQPVSALFLVVIPIIYAFDARFAFLVNAALLFISLLVSLTLAQPSFYKHISKEEGFARIFADGKRIFAFVKTHKRYSGYTMFSAAWHGIQDAVDEFQQIFFQFLQVPVQFFGLIYGANRLMQGVGSYFTHNWKKHFSQLKTLSLLGTSLTIFLLVAASLKSMFGAIIFPLRNAIEGFASPLNQSFLNREITEGDRVTLLSVGNLFAGILKAIFTLLIGLLFDMFSVPMVFTLLALGTAVIMGILYIPAWRAYRQN